MSGIDDDILNNFFTETLSGNKDLLYEILTIYLDEAPDFIQVMKNSIKEDNFSMIQAVAHNLKSNSATIGAMKMHQLAKQIEDNCINHETDNLESLILECDAEYKVIGPLIKDKLKGEVH